MGSRAHDLRYPRSPFLALSLTAIGAASGFLGGCGGSIAPAPVGVLYTETNDPAGNAILGYRRSTTDGSLTALPGSPFAMGGRGVTNPELLDGPNDDDHQVIANSAHTFLYAVNGGSNTIAGFHIEADGSLTAVPGSPFASGGIEPASLGISGEHLYVVNKNLDPGQPSPPDGST